jgi:hypothetical protein
MTEIMGENLNSILNQMARQFYNKQTIAECYGHAQNVHVKKCIGDYRIVVDKKTWQENRGAMKRMDIQKIARHVKSKNISIKLFIRDKKSLEEIDI